MRAGKGVGVLGDGSSSCSERRTEPFIVAGSCCWSWSPPPGGAVARAGRGARYAAAAALVEDELFVDVFVVDVEVWSGFWTTFARITA
jgi:hypothetical protein